MISMVNANALHIPLADGVVQCCITSPPYWSLRDYGTDGQLGLEATPEEYVANMVAVFREVRRVLRPDGTCWLNLGDSYNSNASNQQYITGLHGGDAGMGRNNKAVDTLKPKDLVGIPWRVAFALQADGWWIRSDIIWSKPNPMPESVTDRPTRSHEYVFLLSKSARYFYDQEAVREPVQDVTLQRLSQPNFNNQQGGPKDKKNGNRSERRTLENLKERYTKQGVWEDRFTGYELWKEKGIGRNRRTVWEIPTAPYPGSHFATFPPDLVRPCVLAGTSPQACEKCGAPWGRVVEKVDTGKKQKMADGWDTGNGGHGTIHRSGREKGEGGQPVMANATIGFRPTCACENKGEGKCLVLDPFAGTGTVGMVAGEYGRSFVGVELNPAYIPLALERTQAARLQQVMPL